MLLLSIFLTIFLLSYTIFWWKRRRLYELADKIPGIDGLPFIGSIHEFLGLEIKDYFEKALQITNSPNEKISKAWLGPQLFITLESPKIVQEALKSQHCSNKPNYFYGILYSKYGLLTINGKLFDKHKRILSKSFMPYMLQRVIPVFNQKAKVCVQKLEENLNGSEFDVWNYVGACTMESFATAHLNYNESFYNSKALECLEK